MMPYHCPVSSDDAVGGDLEEQNASLVMNKKKCHVSLATQKNKTKSPVECNSFPGKI